MLQIKHIANFVIASTLALALAPPALAQPAPLRMHMPGEHGPGHVGPTGMHDAGPIGPMMGWRGLGLTEAQHDQVFKIFHEQAPSIREHMKQVRRSREELMKLANAERFDEARVRQVADAQAKALSALAVLHAQSLHRVREILTPEQRARMDQRKERPQTPPR